MAEKKKLVDRGDPLDQGVPMLAGDPSEPVGPEDALGPGPKRGDYKDVMFLNAPHTTETIPPNEREEGGPHTRLVAQKPRVEDVGEAKGKKGGVNSA